MPKRSIVQRWPLWALPGGVLAIIVAVEAVCVVCTAFAVYGSAPVRPDQLFWSATLALFAFVHTALVVGTERTRRRVDKDVNHVDLTSVWTFAGAMILPIWLAALLGLVVHVHVWMRTGRPRAPLHKAAFSAATIVLACSAASWVQRSIEAGGGPAAGMLGVVGLVSAMLVYTVVNNGLVGLVIAASTPQPTVGTVFGHVEDNTLEVACLALGALTAVAISVQPALVVLVLFPLIVLHRAVLVRHLREAADIDGKTGLLNAAAWHTRATNALASQEDRRRAVLVLDLDRFKSVNDAHGHIAGDHVLAAVARVLRAEVRERDLVGRFGGEEFVVLLAGRDGGSAADLEGVAERIRSRVAALQVEVPTPDGPLSIGGLSISVGGALHPVDGPDLGTLLHVADAALYAAKRAGRNAVRMGRAESAQRVRVPRDGVD